MTKTKNKNQQISFKKNKYLHKKLTYDQEIVEIFSKILNVPEERIRRNFDIFQNIDHRTLNALFYLGKITNEQDKICAVHALEFIYRFNKKVY